MHDRAADLQILQHLAAGRMAAARSVLRDHRDAASPRVRTVLSRRTDAAAAGWEAARVAIDAGQHAVAWGHLEILCATALDWRGPGGLLAADALRDLESFRLLSAAAARTVITTHAIERFLERVDSEATAGAARDELASVLERDTTSDGAWRSMGPGGLVLAHPDRPGVSLVVGRTGAIRVLKTVMRR